LNRKTVLLLAVPGLFGLSCCCAAFTLPFGAGALWSWADTGIDVPTAPGTASMSLRAAEWYLGPGQPTYDVIVRRSFGEQVEHLRFAARGVDDRLGIPGLSPEGTYEVCVRLPDGRGGYYDPGVLQFLSLRPDTTTDVVVTVHGGIDLTGVVTSSVDGAVLADVDVQPEPFTYTHDGMVFPMVWGRTDAAGEFAVGGICGAGHTGAELERGVVFRRDGYRERRVHLTFPPICAAVIAARWRVPMEPLASTAMAVSPDLSVTRVDPGSAADRAGLRVGDRVTAVAGVPIATSRPTPQTLVDAFDARDTEIWLTVVGADGVEREVRATIREPDVSG
jgi:hypothetical protein